MFLIPVALLLVSGFAVSVISCRRLEETLPFCILSSICLLYVFYVFDLLLIGFWITLTAILIPIILMPRHMKKWRVVSAEGRISKNNSLFSLLIDSIFSPAMTAFILVMMFLAFWLSQVYHVVNWDELRLWGAYPKLLYFTNSRQLGAQTMMYPIMQSYFPGMPLFVYSMLRLSGSFSEWMIAFSYAFFGLSLLLPLFVKVHWKHAAFFFPICAAFLFLPLYFYNSNMDMCNYYLSIFIDPSLGLLMGYCLFLLYKNPLVSLYSIFEFSVALMVFCLLKDSGAMFAVVFLFTAIVLQTLVNRKEQAITIDNKRLIRNITPMLLGILFALLSWKIALSQYSVTNHVAFKPSNLFKLATELWAFIKVLAMTSILSSNFIDLNRYLSFGSLYFVLFLLDLLTTQDLINKRKAYIMTVVIFICGSLFMLGYYVAYGLSKASLSRYSGTILTGYLLYLLFKCTDIKRVANMRLSISKARALAVGGIIAFLIIASPFHQPVQGDSSFIQSGRMHKTRIINSVQQDLIEASPKNINVYLITGPSEWPQIIHHRIYFELLDTNIFIKSFYNEGKITLDEDANNTALAVKEEEFINKLIDHDYDFVYIAQTDELLKTQYPKIFTGDVHEGTMYKILNEQNGLRLEQITL